MLLDINGKRVHVPPDRLAQLNKVLNRLPQHQVEEMRRQIRAWADETGDTRTDFFASNWKTGNDWKVYANGVFEPLYKACLGRYPNPVEYAGWMYGWLVRLVMAEPRGEDWVMYKNPEAGTDEVPRSMWGTFYWRANRVPS